MELSQVLQQFQAKCDEQESASILIQNNAEESLMNVEAANVNLVEAHEY